jgi:hypothetical protein
LPLGGTGSHGWFSDVDFYDWYFEDVKFVFDAGLMMGLGGDPPMFGSGVNMSRSMIATVLYRLEGGPAVEGVGDSAFSDVPEGQWYSDAVNWGASIGIMFGYPDGSFMPDEAITREQLSTLLYRYAEAFGKRLQTVREYTGFTDEPSIAYYARDAMIGLYKSGLINGYLDGSVQPQKEATRAEFAAMLNRFLGNALDGAPDADAAAFAAAADAAAADSNETSTAAGGYDAAVFANGGTSADYQGVDMYRPHDDGFPDYSGAAGDYYYGSGGEGSYDPLHDLYSNQTGRIDT